MKRLLVCLLLVGLVGCEQPAPAPLAPNKAISKPNKAISEYNKGLDFLDRKDWATAIACFTEAIRIDPDYANAYHNRGVAHRKLGLDVKADADFPRPRSWA